MNLRPNPEPPEVMFIDLNSAFAMTEQQANPLLRGRPVGITNRLNQWSICITSSYEARRQGIYIGTRYREARLKAPNFVMLESDSAKYQFIHKLLRDIFCDYSPVAYMKSVDEGVIDFRGMRRLLKGRPLEDIAYEIKQRVHDEIGDYMTVNIGIAPNRWLAKLATGFMKPNGLYTIDHHNLELVYSLLKLTDLPYISYKNQARLNEAGILTPLEFYQAPEPVLTKQVFKSLNGHLWYLKLRGYETEVEFGIHTVSRNYVLEHRTADPEELHHLLHKFSVKVARRLLRNRLAARGLSLDLRYIVQPADPWTASADWRRRQITTHWSERHMHAAAVRRADQLYGRALLLFAQSPPGAVVTAMTLTAYALEPANTSQAGLFDDLFTRRERLENAINAVNDRYGDLTLAPAAVVASKNPMKDKIPFGSIRYFS